jgi:hypothetical protein
LYPDKHCGEPTRWIHYLTAAARRALRLLDKAVTHASARQMCPTWGRQSSFIVKLDWNYRSSICNEVLWGNQPCGNGIYIQRFGDCFCFHHQGWCDVRWPQVTLGAYQQTTMGISFVLISTAKEFEFIYII